MLALGALDWAVMALYMGVVLAIGWQANRRQESSEDYFLGGRRLRWWVVGISLLATSFSAVSLMGGTGFGYTTGMKWLQLQLGDLLALALVCAVFLPFFSILRLTTAYEYLEVRFGVVARSVAAVLFVIQTLLRASILIYTPALAMSALLGWDVQTAILVAAAAAILYSAFGGIGAVVWTDLIQVGVILFAVGYCLVLVAGDVPGGLGAVLDHAREGGRLEVLTQRPQRGSIFNLLGSVAPYGVLALSLFGTGQQAVQRFLSCADLGAARRAALTGWAAGTITLGLTLFLGVCIHSWSQLAPAGADFAAAKGDEVLPRFIALRLPAGVAGLMLAAIFAASMSSLDSAIHSMSTVAIVDFLRRFRRSKPKAGTELLIARFGTVLFGLLAVAGALYAAEASTQILETMVTWLGYFAGPLLGLFLLGMLTKRATERSALLGVGVAFAAEIAVLSIAGPKPWGLHPLWLAPGSFAVAFLVGWLTGRPRSGSPRVR